MPASTRPVECLLVVALIAGGAWLRWTYLAVVAWAPNIPTTTPPGMVGTAFDGAMLYELAER